MRVSHYLGSSPAGFHKIFYTEWGVPNSYRHDGAAVICVHGLTRNGRDFDSLAEYLGKERHVFCPDIAGRRKSDWLTEPSYYSYQQYVADMVSMIARIGAYRADWVGTSMGGIIGMLLAAQKGSPIRKLVLNDIGPLIPFESAQRIRSYVGQLPVFADLDEAEIHMRKIYAPFGHISDEGWKSMAENGTRALPDGTLTLSYDPAIAENFKSVDKDIDLWAIYEKISCPVLILRGENSDILSEETADRMTKEISDAKLVTIKGCGHAPSLMNEEQINIVADFLNAP